MQDNLELGYHQIKGLAEPIRWLLAHLQIDYKETNPDGDAWYGGEKFNMGLDFPNLPYLIDGDFKLTESVAIPEYIIKKTANLELLGKTIEDQAKVCMIRAVARDVRVIFSKLIGLKTGHKEAIQEILEKRPFEKKCEQFGALIGDKDFFLDYLTLADLEVAYWVYYWRSMVQSLGLDNPFTHERYGRLNGLIERVSQASPGLIAYFQGQKWRDIPFHSKPYVYFDFTNFPLDLENNQ